MANAWLEWEAERAAKLAVRQALPQYGGNNIPDSYLERFNAATHDWLVRIGARKPEVEFGDVPEHIADFARLL